MNDPTDAHRQAATRVWRHMAQHSLERNAFSGRGFKDRTVEAIVVCGIYEPERLLFMSEAQLKNIPGIGKASMSEIRAYRNRFLKLEGRPEGRPFDRRRGLSAFGVMAQT